MQGIDSSIAGHLDHLTRNWVKFHQLSNYNQRLYKRGERVCKIWANANTLSKTSPLEQQEIGSDSHSINSSSTLDDDSSIDTFECPKIQKKASRFTFNESMYDLLQGTIIMKVYSHQLTKDFQISVAGKTPQPNMFVASANQIVDNTAEQARHLARSTFSPEWEKIFYPPFSPQWSFSFEGGLTNKGATKTFHEKLDMELLHRHQCRPKQGIFFRMLPFIGLNAQQIGDESLLRNIVKMTAPSWTRWLYRYPHLAAQAWDSWYHSLTDEEQANVPSKLPRDWRKDNWAANHVLRVCPACSLHRKNRIYERMGTLEHMHLYCEAPQLIDARNHCYSDIETALTKLYNFAAEIEYEILFSSATRQTKLQEDLEYAALQTELAERPICDKSTTINHRRPNNIAILSRHEVQVLTLMDKLPPEMLQEYDAFPLAHRAGLIHSIAEEDLSIENATIIDVTFLGLFPKSLLEVLRKYKNGLKQDAQPEFDFLIRGLISAVIYRAITIQHIIQYLLVAIKLQIETDCQKRQEALSTNDEKEPELCSSIHSSSATSTPTAGSNDSTPRKLRYANKCQFLLAKGILRAPVPCAKGRNICPGCILESARQRKTAMVENDIIQAKTSNLILIPCSIISQHPSVLKSFVVIFSTCPPYKPPGAMKASLVLFAI